MTKNLLNEVKLSRTAEPFCRRLFQSFKFTLLALFLKIIRPTGAQFFTCRTQKPQTKLLSSIHKLDDATNLIIQLARGSFIAKTDICSAFRNIPVHPSDWELLADWQGLYFFDKVLPFALPSAPFIFNQLSDALEWIAKQITT